ncbi:MAG: hypothetical protein FD129_1192, partial [bacterium]
SKRHADIIIPEGVENHVGVDILRTKVHALVSSMARSARPVGLSTTAG